MRAIHLITLAILCLSALTSPLALTRELKSIPKVDANYLLQGFRGFLKGYQSGLYKTD